jgi:hypothetical protein
VLHRAGPRHEGQRELGDGGGQCRVDARPMPAGSITSHSSGFAQRDDRGPPQPPLEVVDHLSPVDLVEDLVSRVLVHANGDVAKTGVAVSVDERPQQGEVGVDRVFRTDRDVQGKVARHARYLGGIGESACTGEHVSGRSGVDPEPAQRVGEIGIDHRLVTREPVLT